MTHDDYHGLKMLLDDLKARIDQAPGTSKPVFPGIATLHAIVASFDAPAPAGKPGLIRCVTCHGLKASIAYEEAVSEQATKGGDRLIIDDTYDSTTEAERRETIQRFVEAAKKRVLPQRDRGQRYEVRAAGYPIRDESAVGWSDDQLGAEYVAKTFRQAPGCVCTTIFDRKENKTVIVQYAGALR